MDMFFCFWYVEAVKCSAQPWFLFSMSEHGNHHGMSHSLQHGCVDVKLGILPVFGINVAAVALKLKSLLDCSKVCVEFSSAVWIFSHTYYLCMSLVQTVIMNCSSFWIVLSLLDLLPSWLVSAVIRLMEPSMYATEHASCTRFLEG